MLALRHVSIQPYIYSWFWCCKTGHEDLERKYTIPIPAHQEIMDNFAPLTPTYGWLFHDLNLQPPTNRMSTFLLCYSRAMQFNIKAKCALQDCTLPTLGGIVVQQVALLPRSSRVLLCLCGFPLHSLFSFHIPIHAYRQIVIFHQIPKCHFMNFDIALHKSSGIAL